LCAVLYVNAIKDFTKPLHRELPGAQTHTDITHKQGEQKYKTLNQQLFRL